MAKKAKSYKVDYKALTREVKKTLKKLRDIEKKVKGKELEDIQLQIKSLDYLSGVCEATPPKMSGPNCAAPTTPPARMSGCALVPPPKMSRIYGGE